MTVPVDHSVRRARSAISLGAAVAIFGAVLLGYDAPASQAAGGFFEALFGIGRAPDAAYDGYGYGSRRHRFSHVPRRIRLAHQARRHDMQARRRVAERRKSMTRHYAAAVGEQKRTVGPAVIEIIGPARNPFVEVIGTAGSGPRPESVARTAAPEPRTASQECPKPCILATASAPSPRVSPLRATPTPDIFADPTLRPGDTIITADGVRILRHGSRFPFKASDFISLAEAGKARLANRSALGEIERALKTPLGRPPADL
jgi:hypothetical protein